MVNARAAGKILKQYNRRSPIRTNKITGRRPGKKKGDIFMKRILTVAVVIMMVMTMVNGTYAADLLPKPQINVSASIAKNCKEMSTALLPLIAAIDTSSSVQVDVAATTDEVIRCTKGATPITVTATSGNFPADSGLCTVAGVPMKMKSPTEVSATDVIPYLFKCSNGSGYTGAGFGAAGDLALGINVSVVPSDAADATIAADYADIVTLTIAY
jgi:hypothetical protein